MAGAVTAVVRPNTTLRARGTNVSILAPTGGTATSLGPRAAGPVLVLVFEKPSLRTRATFAVGMAQLGGTAIYLGPAEVGLGTRETPADCARNLDRWFDLIPVRTFAHEIIEEMAEHSSVPVINSLTDDFHPCQVLADCQTLIEHKGKLAGL